MDQIYNFLLTSVWLDGNPIEWTWTVIATLAMIGCFVLYRWAGGDRVVNRQLYELKRLSRDRWQRLDDIARGQRVIMRWLCAAIWFIAYLGWRAIAAPPANYAHAWLNTVDPFYKEIIVHWFFINLPGDPPLALNTLASSVATLLSATCVSICILYMFGERIRGEMSRRDPPVSGTLNILIFLCKSALQDRRDKKAAIKAAKEEQTPAT